MSDDDVLAALEIEDTADRIRDAEQLVIVEGADGHAEIRAKA